MPILIALVSVVVFIPLAHALGPGLAALVILMGIGRALA